MPRLELEDLTVRFPGVGGSGRAVDSADSAGAAASTTALDRLSLTVDAGEVVALLGPSGCGKTTLLRVVAGLEAPTSGRVLLDGEDLAGVPPHRRRMGLMFQDYALFPHRDVGGNVEFGLRMQGMDPAERTSRVQEVLELVGLPGLAAREVDSLSGGERQRVALARSVAPAPRVLMLDEPLGALDRNLRERLVLDLQGVFAELGLTVVYVTHDQTEALALADRLVVMDRGRVAQLGEPREVWSAPQNEFVARFFGLANIVDAVVDGSRLRAPWGTLVADLGPASRLADGPVRVLIRPEALSVTGPGAAEGQGARESGRSSTALRATVASVVFQGDRDQLSLAVAPGVELETSFSGDPLLEVGDAVSIAIDPAGVGVLGPSACAQR